MRSLYALLITLLSFQCLANIDSLINITKTRQDTNAVLAGYELGKAFVGRSLDSSLMFLREAAKLADELDYTHGKIVTYRSIGSVAPRVGEYEESLHWLNKGLRMIDSLELPIGNKVDFLTNLGVAHYRIGLLGKAIEPYIEAVEICRVHGLDDRRSRLLNNLGIFYRNLKRYDEAIGIYEQSYELREASKDTSGMGNLLFNMASAYSKLKDQENAIKKLDEAEAMYASIGSEDDVIHCKIGKGSAYVELEQPDKAYAQFIKALDFPYEKLVNPFNYNLYQGLAYISLLNGKPNEAEMYVNKIAKDVVGSEFAEQSLRHYELMSEIDKVKGRYKNAYENLHSLKTMTEKISEEDKATFRQEMETKYLSLEKDHEIELLNSDKKVTEIQLQSARQRNYGLGIGLLLFGGLIAWLYKLFKKTEQQNTVITKANKEKEILLKEIHHRVKNNLQVVSSLLTLQSKYVDNDSALDAINTGKARVQSMSILHRNLYQNENLKNIKIKKYFEDLSENLIKNYHLNDKDISIETDIEDLELDVDTVIPMGLITNELISNSLKYAFEGREKGTLKLSITSDEKHINLILSDDGIGIPFDEIPVKSKTLGMQLIKSFSKKLKADVVIDNKNGTSISLQMPLQKIPA